MFDVYLNDRRDLLVVRKGLPIPPADVSGRWRKKKRAVSVSEEIVALFRGKAITSGK